MRKYRNKKRILTYGSQKEEYNLTLTIERTQVSPLRYRREDRTPIP